jgi:hypothetical protein
MILNFAGLVVPVPKLIASVFFFSDIKSRLDHIHVLFSKTNPAKFKIIDGGSTLEIKSLNEKDITDYCYYCKIDTTPSKCKNILDQKNHVG